MSEWKEYIISDTCSRLSSGKAIKASLLKDVGSFPVYGGNGIRGYTDTYNFEGECAIIGRQGAACGNVRYFSGKAYMTEHAVVAVPNEHHDAYYLSCVLASMKLGRLSGQSAQPGIGVGLIGKQVISLPPLSTQRRIASILSSLDDKIAINRRICENLEAQAQALFKHWFIDFAPFKNGKFVESELGMIPEGWRVGTLGEICKCELGGTPSRANKSYWGGDIAWINSGEVNKFRVCEASEYITEEGLNHSATKLLPAKTTVLAITGATLGQVSLLEIDSCANQSVVGVKENNKIPYAFIYPAIKSKINELVNMQTGGAQQHINKDNIQSLKIIVSPQNVMEEYKSVTIPLYDEIGNICFENSRLSALRDTLLPKLMSGEIKV